MVPSFHLSSGLSRPAHCLRLMAETGRCNLAAGDWKNGCPSPQPVRIPTPKSNVSLIGESVSGSSVRTTLKATWLRDILVAVTQFCMKLLSHALFIGYLWASALGTSDACKFQCLMSDHNLALNPSRRRMGFKRCIDALPRDTTFLKQQRSRYFSARAKTEVPFGILPPFIWTHDCRYIPPG